MNKLQHQTFLIFIHIIILLVLSMVMVENNNVMYHGNIVIY